MLVLIKALASQNNTGTKRLKAVDKKSQSILTENAELQPALIRKLNLINSEMRLAMQKLMEMLTCKCNYITR